MNKKFWVIVGIVVVAFCGIIGFSKVSKTDKPVDYSRYQRSVIQEMSKEINYDEYDLNTIIAADDSSGHLPEKIVGNPDAPVVIFEYADYACLHCAEINNTVNEIIEDYGPRVAVVFRGFVLQFPNSMITAAAANAAAIQGYWKEYKDLLFDNQNEWFYLRGTEMQGYLETLFKQASEGMGDMDKFRTDMVSEAVAKRMAFDYGLGEKIGLTGTPTFIVNGKIVSPTDLRATVRAAL